MTTTTTATYDPWTPADETTTSARQQRINKRKGTVRQIRYDTWIVDGQRKLGDKHPTYTVIFSDGDWNCECYTTKYGDSRQHKTCTHVAATKHYDNLEDKSKEHTTSGLSTAGEKLAAPLPDPHSLWWGQPPLPDWITEFRPHQTDAVVQICDAYTTDNVVILNAPTGSGKTLIAELTRRNNHYRKTLYATTTLSLQDQFVNDFEYAKLVKSARNYPTLRDNLWPTVTCAECDHNGTECSWCDPPSLCPARKAKTDALCARLTVANIQYLLHTWNHTQNFVNYDLCVIDEADTLENQLMNYVEFSVPNRTLNNHNIRIPPPNTRKPQLAEWLHEITVQLARQINKLDNIQGDPKIIRERKTLNNIRTRAATVALDLIDDPDLWIRDNKQSGKFVLKPIRVNKFGSDLIWQHAKRWLLMSATVVSAEQMVQDLGIPETQTINK